MTDEAVDGVVSARNLADALCVARSRSNQMIFFLLVAATCGASFFFDILLFGRFGIFTIVFVLVTIWQGLRTYVVRTVFTSDRIEHRTALGIWHGAEYSRIMILEDRNESITIFGEDLMGRGLKFSLVRRDGNLGEIVAFLRSKIPSRHDAA